MVPALLADCGPEGRDSARFGQRQPEGRKNSLSSRGETGMAEIKTEATEVEITRERLAELLNEDLSREYQAIISYVVYSQVLTGAEYTDIAAQLEIHARQELEHALIISRQIDYLGKMPAMTPKP